MQAIELMHRGLWQKVHLEKEGRRFVLDLPDDTRWRLHITTLSVCNSRMWLLHSGIQLHTVIIILRPSWISRTILPSSPEWKGKMKTFMLMRVWKPVMRLMLYGLVDMRVAYKQCHVCHCWLCHTLSLAPFVVILILNNLNRFCPLLTSEKHRKCRCIPESRWLVSAWIAWIPTWRWKFKYISCKFCERASFHDSKPS